MYRTPTIPAPDLSTAAAWEYEEREQNERDDLALGFSPGAVSGLTERWEIEYDRMEAERDSNEEVFDRYA